MTKAQTIELLKEYVSEEDMRDVTDAMLEAIADSAPMEPFAVSVGRALFQTNCARRDVRKKANDARIEKQIRKMGFWN